MAEDIKALIEKINQEGVQAAEKRAREIERAAQEKASEILSKAKREADAMLQEARERIAKIEEKEKTLLSQAGRDLLLVLREEINAMLTALISREVRATLTPENMYKIISTIIQSACSQEDAAVTITLSAEDARALEGALLVKLKEETKKQIVLRPQENIHGGFVISFDAGQSQFDFSDKALAEYLGTYLKPKLKEILQG